MTKPVFDLLSFRFRIFLDNAPLTLVNELAIVQEDRSDDTQ